MHHHQLANHFSFKWLIEYKVTHTCCNTSGSPNLTHDAINLFLLYPDDGDICIRSFYPKRPLLATSSRASVLRARQRQRKGRVEFLRPASWRKRRGRSNAVARPPRYSHPAQKAHLENLLKHKSFYSLDFRNSIIDSSHFEHECVVVNESRNFLLSSSLSLPLDQLYPIQIRI